jgi:alpha-methylacyl-CoA racemase
VSAIGNAGQAPVAPLNLVGDFGGGALYLAFGMACALLEARHSGQGQVVDAAMTDGASSLMTMFFGMHAAGLYSLDRGTNVLDGGSAIYGVYPCADGHYVSVAAIEMKFRADLFRLLGIEPGDDGPELGRRIDSIRPH